MRRQLNSGQKAFRGEAGGETFLTRGWTALISDDQRRADYAQISGCLVRRGTPAESREMPSDATREAGIDRPALILEHEGRFAFFFQRHPVFAMSLDKAGYTIVESVITGGYSWHQFEPLF